MYIIIVMTLSCSSLLIFTLSPPLIVSVTAIHHFPLAAGLLVGYSFGGFQLYSLLDSTLLYSLPLILRRLPTPVTHFAVQEPENDPKNFLYVWVSRNGPKAQHVLVVYIHVCLFVWADDFNNYLFLYSSPPPHVFK